MNKKILYSPGYGAGWSTWLGGSEEFTKWALTYQPLIDVIEANPGINLTNNASYDEPERFHPVLQQFLKDAKEKFNEEPYVGGADQLCVYTVTGPFRIDNYDGSESVTEAHEQAWIEL